MTDSVSLFLTFGSLGQAKEQEKTVMNEQHILPLHAGSLHKKTFVNATENRLTIFFLQIVRAYGAYGSRKEKNRPLKIPGNNPF